MNIYDKIIANFTVKNSNINKCLYLKKKKAFIITFEINDT